MEIWSAATSGSEIHTIVRHAHPANSLAAVLFEIEVDLKIY